MTEKNELAASLERQQQRLNQQGDHTFEGQGQKQAAVGTAHNYRPSVPTGVARNTVKRGSLAIPSVQRTDALPPDDSEAPVPTPQSVSKPGTPNEEVCEAELPTGPDKRDSVGSGGGRPLDRTNYEALRLTLKAFNKTARDPAVIKLSRELSADFELPSAPATGLAILKLTKADPELYEELLRAVSLAYGGMPAVKISRVAEPSNVMLKVADGQVFLAKQTTFRTIDRGRIAMANQIKNIVSGQPVTSVEYFEKYLNSKKHDHPKDEVKKTVMITTPEREYIFIFENIRAAGMFTSVIDLHQGEGHQCFHIHTTANADLAFYHKSLQLS